VSRRIPACFETLAGAGRTALIPYLTAGDPQPGWTVAIMHALVDAGSDLLELGVPCPDPVADGPVIRQANQRAIKQQVTLATVLEMVATFRQQDNTTPVVLMGYLNPLERYGRQRFPAAAKKVGVDGLLLVDCPPEERGDLGEAMIAVELDGICLVTPTTTRRQIETIAAAASGFIYYVSLRGTTGSGQLKLSELAAPLQQIRQFSALPLAVGFGITNAATAAVVASQADAVVMGSALVERLAVAGQKAEACAIAKAFVAPVRKAMDNTGSSTATGHHDLI